MGQAQLEKMKKEGVVPGVLRNAQFAGLGRFETKRKGLQGL